MMNHALFPEGTHCDSSYVGFLSFIMSLENLKSVFDKMFGNAAVEINKVLAEIKALPLTTPAGKAAATSVKGVLDTRLRSLTTLKTDSDKWVGGYIHSIMPTTLSDLMKTKYYIILSWQDLAFLINALHEKLVSKELTVIDDDGKTPLVTIITAARAASPSTPTDTEQADYLHLLALAVTIRQMRNNIYAHHITELLNVIKPCVPLTKSTLGLNLDVSMKLPFSADNFDNLSFHILKIRNVREMHFKSPYFGDRVLASANSERNNGFYYLVPYFLSSHLDSLNHLSITSADKVVKASIASNVSAGRTPEHTAYSTTTNAAQVFTKVETTKELERFLDTLGVFTLENYPIYTEIPQFKSYVYGTCIGAHVEPVFTDFAYENFFIFNSLNYYSASVRFASARKRQVKAMNLITIAPITIPAGSIALPSTVATPTFNAPLQSKPKKTSSTKKTDADAFI